MISMPSRYFDILAITESSKLFDRRAKVSNACIIDMMTVFAEVTLNSTCHARSPKKLIAIRTIALDTRPLRAYYVAHQEPPRYLAATTAILLPAGIRHTFTSYKQFALTSALSYALHSFSPSPIYATLSACSLVRRKAWPQRRDIFQIFSVAKNNVLPM